MNWFKRLLLLNKKEAVDAYIAAVSTKSDLERTELSKEKKEYSLEHMRLTQ